MSHVTDIPDVLTLEEVAAYLRLPKDMVARQAAQGAIPGRQIEDTWRFLKAAIDDWLRSHDDRTLLLQQAGALVDDESLPALREEIYRTRKRPEISAEQDS
jgi:excisionase family DNA binding protein